MNNEIRQQLRDLQSYGWDVDKESKIVPNTGSETMKHLVAKACVAHIGQEYGYRIAGEATHEELGSIDVLLWGHSERLTYAVEVETSPERETMLDKARRYVGGPVDDLLWCNVSAMPVNVLEAREYVQKELGL